MKTVEINEPSKLKRFLIIQAIATLVVLFFYNLGYFNGIRSAGEAAFNREAIEKVKHQAELKAVEKDLARAEDQLIRAGLKEGELNYLPLPTPTPTPTPSPSPSTSTIAP